MQIRQGARGVALVAGLALCILWQSPAHSQGFMVRPMILELAPSPGDRFTQTIEIRNTTPQEQKVQVRAWELTQGPTGGWQTAGQETSPAGARSALDFMQMSANEITLGAQEGGSVDLTFRVPSRARGFYGAALLVNSVPTEDRPGHVAMVVQFLIPILIQIRERSALEEISLAGLDMKYIPAGTRAISPMQTREFPATTEVTAVVTNTGETLGRISGEVVVEGMVNDKWRHVARIDMRQGALIPGSEFSMVTDLQKRLPSGQYRLTASIRLGGRFAGRQERIIDFEGDPEIKTLQTDVPLMMDDLVTVEAVAGATRSAGIRIQNPTDQEVHVATAIAAPPGLRGVALGDLDGMELTAQDWLEVVPESFRLPGGAERALRIVSRAPADLAEHSNFYADLHIGAFYPDGQTAGRWKTVINASVPTIEPSPIVKLENLLVAQTDTGPVVTAQFANLGDVHMRPGCEARLRNAEVTALTAQLSSETKLALPLALMEWSGELDLTTVQPGSYLLDVVLMYGEESTTGQLQVKVVEEDGQKTLQVVEDAAPAPEGDTDDAE